ncbi:hypothetical protein [Microbacterium sp. NPDC057944]|uniref:hypothetical protein n=1 Tax=Microbacterium sp. NPDC057944 TaxID=3346286 RepID=UPI0036DE77C0
MPVSFDMSALSAPVDPAVAHREFQERIDREGRRTGARVGMAWSVFQTVVLVAGGGILAALAVVAVQLAFGGEGLNAATVIIAALVVAPLAVARVRSYRTGPDAVEADVYRLTRFAAANGLSHVLAESDPDLPAALFQVGGARVASDVMVAASPRRFEVANYSYETWTARTRMPRSATFAVLESGIPLPAMTIRAASPSDQAGAWAPQPQQTPLPFEGGFGSTFRVFCAVEDADRVRAVLTEPVQTALIALVRHGDVEIAGGSVFFLARRQLRLADVAFWEWVEDLVAMVDAVDDGGVRVGASADPARRVRREALFDGRRSSRPFVLGCLLPLVVGLAAAALVTAFSH